MQSHQRNPKDYPDATVLLNREGDYVVRADSLTAESGLDNLILIGTV